MTRRWVRVTVAVVLLAAVGTLAWAQTPTGAITGTVADSAGDAVTGATVQIRHATTGATRQVFTNVQGAFTFATIEPGQYSVTITRLGYKVVVIADVTVAAGQTAPRKVVLEIKVIPPPSTGIPITLDADDMNRLPLPLRSMMDAVAFLPGVNTLDITRHATVNGLTGAFVSVTFDGVSDEDNYEKSTGGFLAWTSPRPDGVATAAATLTAPPADVAGAAQIAFRTRSGSDRWLGAVYQSFRSPGLAANDWFSENAGQPEADGTLNQFGARGGGPIGKPGAAARVFAFLNYEQLRRSGTVSRRRAVLNSASQSGVFRYQVSSGGAIQIREVNLLSLAGAAAVGNALDPTVGKVLNDIRQSTAAAEAGGRAVNGRHSQTSDPKLMAYEWQSPVDDLERQPVLRLDANLTSKHRVGVTYSWESVTRDADVVSGDDLRFPGFGNSSGYESRRPMFGATVRSTLSDTIINEVTIGTRWGATEFGSETGTGAGTFSGSGGYALALGLGLTDAHASNEIASRTADSWTIQDVVNWQKGKHAFTFGGAIHLGRASVVDRQPVSAIGFGVDAADPALALFSSTNLPGASPEQRAAAASLYALLTGRVNNVGSYATLNGATNAYELLGRRSMAGRQTEYALFAQDVIRLSPKTTLTAGVRWTLQMPFTSDANTMAAPTYADACGISGLTCAGVCRFYQVGSTAGVEPTFKQFGPVREGWNLDWNNFAPSVSLAWRPSVEKGALFYNLFGDPEVGTLRLGYAEGFAREGMGRYLDLFGMNPGARLNVGRSNAYANLVGTGSYPVYLQQPGRLGPAEYPATAVYPIAARPGRIDDIGLMLPEISVGRARTFTASLLRSASESTTVEVRWVGTRGTPLWGVEDYNEIDVFQNGFYNEFRLAMVNLEKNLAAGRGATFAYFGPGTGTSPLPVYLAYLNGQAPTAAGNPSAYAGADWQNLTLISRLSLYNADPYGAAADLDRDGVRRANALAAGIASNYFLLNPAVGKVSMYDSKGSSSHDAIQVHVNRRMSRGVQVSGSYQYAWATATKFVSQRFGYLNDSIPTVRRALKVQGVWSAPWGIAVSGVARVQQQTVDFGNVRLVGLTEAQLADEYGVRFTDDPQNPGRRIVTMLPADIILNTQRAFSTDPTSSTGYSALGVPQGRYIAPANSENCIQIEPGDCSPRTLLVQAPWLSRIDVSVAKAFTIRGRLTGEIRLDVFNLFNAVNFTPVANPGSSPTIFQVTSAYSDLYTYDAGARMAQFVWRVRW